MTIETFFKKDKSQDLNNKVENSENSILQKLNSFGLNYEYKKDKDGKLIYQFNNVKEADGGAFWLDSKDMKILFQTFHFDEGKFKNPTDKSEITSDELFKYISEKFPDANEIVYSCCHPDDAKIALENTPNNKLLIIGSGSSEYKTIHNSNKNFIKVLPA